MQRIALYVLLSVLLGAISSAGPQPALAQSGPSVSFVTIAQGKNSSIREPARFVIRDQAAWRSLWRRHSGTTAAPAVNFSRNMVIAVFAGEFAEPAAVAILRITREPNRLTVLYRAGPTRPLPDGYTVVAPFHIVRVARSALPVRFLKIKTPPIVRQP